MGTFPADDAIREIIRAHGGADLWRSFEAVETVISAHGFLFTAKRRPALERVRMRAWTREPRFSFLDYPQPGPTLVAIEVHELRGIKAGQVPG